MVETGSFTFIQIDKNRFSVVIHTLKNTTNFVETLSADPDALKGSIPPPPPPLNHVYSTRQKEKLLT